LDLEINADPRRRLLLARHPRRGAPVGVDQDRHGLGRGLQREALVLDREAQVDVILISPGDTVGGPLADVAASRAVADQIATIIREKAAKGQKAVLGLATGSTPKAVYEALVELHKEESLLQERRDVQPR
jgi:hypothetical protein